jgi:hypothetical protein
VARSDDADGSQADLAVARELASQLLKSRENVTRPPTEREVTFMVHHGVAASCRPRSAHLFACSVRIPGAPHYGCIAFVNGTRATNLHCGTATRPATVVNQFAECSRIADDQTIADPRGDTFSRRASRVGTPRSAGGPKGDVTAVAVAASDHELCAAFTFAARPSADTVITFIAGRARTTRASESLSMTIRLGGRLGAEVTTLNHGAISARVGTNRRRVSVVIDAAALPPGLRYLYTSAFRFHAHTSYRASGDSSGGAVEDEAADGARWPEYRHSAVP